MVNLEILLHSTRGLPFDKMLLSVCIINKFSFNVELILELQLDPEQVIDIGVNFGT